MNLTWRALIGLTVLLAGTAVAQARPPYKKALADYFGPLLPRHLNDCRTCHRPDSPENESTEAKPHNPFGARLKAVRKELAKAGKETDIITRLQAIADEDSDGDGVPNLIELLSGHNPGEADDKPDAAGIARAKKVLAAFQSRTVYPWKPFEAVQRPRVPQLKNAAWAQIPIDAFIAADHELYDLNPRPDVAKHTLVRRVYLDLIGLPPTRAELAAALGDNSGDWYEKTVDKLLASPRYGERWGRHWMDVWRYVDYGGSALQDGWTGAPNMWRWRDWIIASLNADKGYDRMVQEMLAADELCPADLDAQPATCFLARNKGNNRDMWLHDSVNHTTRAFLGITMECARCHNHMYDPIKQDEYYRLRAVFEPYGVRTDPARDYSDPKKGSGLTRVYDQNLNPRTYFYIRGVEQNPDKNKEIQSGVPALLGVDGFTVTAVTLPREAYTPHRHPGLIAQLRTDQQHDLAEARAAFDELKKTKPQGALAEAEMAAAEARLKAAEARGTALEAVLRAEEIEDREMDKKDTAAWEQVATAADAAQRQAALLDARHKKLAAQLDVLRAEDAMAKADVDKAKRALTDAEKALAQAEQQARQQPSPKYQRRGSGSYPKTSSGRRLALARWITSRSNPLAGRVAVNHVWLRHFGQAIVPSVFDFGAGGQPPSHPGLLDWLAAEFMENGWSMKKLHRLMVTSRTYRMSATPDPVNLAADPDNLFLWRMPSRRMEAEVVRDSIFHVAGNLDPAMKGPELDPKRGLEVRRRSIYFKYTESDYLRVMEYFDAPPPDDCYRRPESIVPQQALTLLNSDLALTQARLLARTLAKEVGGEPDAFVKAAFDQVLSRPATAAETETCVKFLAEQTRYLEANKARLIGVAAGSSDGSKGAADPALRARENLVHLLLNHHDFVTIR